jgi:pimeloyl-ACP methyl ester carboxylesterase
MRRLALLFVTLALGAGSCAPPEAPTAQVRMDFLRPGSLFDAPFPAPDLQAADGTVDVAHLPPGGRVAIVDQIRAALVGAHGYGTTAPVQFSLTEEPDTSMWPHDARRSEVARFPVADDQAVVQLIDVDPDSPMRGQRIPLEVYYASDAGPFGGHDHVLTLLPVQGWPMRASTRYAAIVTDALLTMEGRRFAPSASMRAIRNGAAPPDINGLGAEELAHAVAALTELHVDLDHVVGMTTFRTQDPTEVLERGIDSVRGRDSIVLDAPFALEETYDDYCVYHTTVHVPVYQAGDPPYATTGGGWVFDQTGALVVQQMQQANVLITLPRRTMPTDGFPIVTLVRTGAGGDRPLVDRGIDPMPHMGATPGTGPAMHFAQAGFAGVQIDGPHGGLRNVTHGDEQFLVFNIQNPTALRDNLRQSALELDLLVDLLATIRIDSSGCMGLVSASGEAHVDVRQLALMGHSMGASIAPLAAAFEPRYRAIILSGAGASWLENIVYKQSPIATRPLAEAILGYTGVNQRTLREDDPVLGWLQWAGEESDAAVYAPLLVRESPAGQARHILMFQGIVDTYILPAIANPMTIATGLDLAGPAIDQTDMRLSHYQSIMDVLPLRGRRQQSFPVSANLPAPGGTMVTGAVVQHMQDGVEDGHEIMWQLPDAQAQYTCFLRTFLTGAPRIVDAGAACP